MADEFNIKTGEYAKMLGITKEALRSKRRRGQLDSEFKQENGVYLWRRPASNHGSNQVVKSSSSLAARSRGNHIEGRETKYPNRFFEQHNEIKMLARLQSNVDQETQELLPEALEIAKAKKREKLQKQLDQKPKKNYGGPIDPRIDAIQREQKRRARNYWEIRREDAPRQSGSFSVFKFQGSSYDWSDRSADTIEVEPRSSFSDQRPTFKSKVDEHIWMLKNKKK